MVTRRAPVPKPTNVKSPTEAVNTNVKPGLLKQTTNTTQRSATPAKAVKPSTTTTVK
ncbi:hypothetical protein DLP3_033 [Stenotrophomonas phage vB_SmaS_DLP_3]|nr:hypothetical protein DLP3_033 [Stenotrophomonas phage vB_SmaS_DLP_3]